MVTHRLFSLLIYILLANSTCWPLIHFFIGQLNVLAYLFFFTGQLNVLASRDFFLLAKSTCWPLMMIFFTSQLNVLAYYTTARWISSALVSRLPTCSENIS